MMSIEPLLRKIFKLDRGDQMESNQEGHIELTLGMSEAVFKFIESLFEDDVNDFWQRIYEVDQARLYGIYETVLVKEELNTEVYSFPEFIESEVINKLRYKFSKFKNNPGVASHLRFDENGMPMVFLLENVVAERHYIAEVEENVHPVYLGLNSTFSNKEVSVEWKVRLYNDISYKHL